MNATRTVGFFVRLTDVAWHRLAWCWAPVAVWVVNAALYVRDRRRERAAEGREP